MALTLWTVENCLATTYWFVGFLVLDLLINRLRHRQKEFSVIMRMAHVLIFIIMYLLFFFAGAKWAAILAILFFRSVQKLILSSPLWFAPIFLIAFIIFASPIWIYYLLAKLKWIKRLIIFDGYIPSKDPHWQ